MSNAEATVYHEAGHAIVAAALGCPITEVAIAPHPRLRCWHRRHNPAEPAIVALAGNLAEQRACPWSCWDAFVDLQRALDAAEYLTPTDPLERLQIFLDQAEAILDQHWPEVEAVARALLKHGRLTGEQVAGIIDSLSG